jgi:hypothetical protein
MPNIDPCRWRFLDYRGDAFTRDACYGVRPWSAAAADADVDAVSSVDKDDQAIKVDKILTDKKYNVWNLPSKARVLLVSNVPAAVANPRFVSPFLYKHTQPPVVFQGL